MGASSPNNGTSPKTVTATCPNGKVVLGGGGRISGAAGLSITASYPSSNTVWTVTAERHSGSGNWSVRAYVVCATVG
jgi:hypothetical protein